MKIMRLSARLSAIALTLIMAGGSTAFAKWNDSISWKASVESSFLGGQHSPFWFETNRQGLPSSRSNSGYVRVAAQKSLDDSRRFSWGACADIAVPWRGESPWVIQQLYGEVKYRCLDALVGSKELWGEYNNPYLSSGNLLYSGNARPIPQVRLGIFDYADIWGTKGWLGVKGYIAYGKFTDSKWQKNWVEPGTKYTQGVLYHSKGIWIRNGNADKFPLVGEAGIEMATQFAGETFNYAGSGTYYKMPDGIKAWIKAFIPKAGGSSTHITEQQNVEGNMVGAWQFRLSWLPAADWSVRAYYEHYFEDHSMLYIEYPWKDGLYGIEGNLPSNPFVSSIVYEFLYMKDQAGPVNWNKTEGIPEQVSGADEYYNHHIYDGWEHWGMGIGTPLALSPIFNDPHLMKFRSTRVISHHLGFCGNPIPDIDWRVLLTYTRSWGSYTYVFPEVEKAFNGLAEVTWRPSKLKGWEGTVGLGLDHGSLTGNSAGLMIRISKSGIFGKR